MPSEAVDVDHGQLVGRCLKDCPVVVDLHAHSPVGKRAPGGRDGRAAPKTRHHSPRPTQPSRPRPPSRLQVQLRVLNFLKAALALVDHFVQDAHACIQIRMPDPVGVKRVELINLRHAS